MANGPGEDAPITTLSATDPAAVDAETAVAEGAASTEGVLDASEGTETAPTEADQTRARLRRAFKTFMVVSEQFRCKAKCPYCTAKITKWPKPEGGDNWDKMEGILAHLDNLGVWFEYLTISGNGEPSEYDLDTLKLWADVFERYSHLFTYMRMQTWGNIFDPAEQEKWEVVKDFVFEITRPFADSAHNAAVLGIPDYTQWENFKNSKVVFNHVLLKDRKDSVVEDVRMYLSEYPNMQSLNLKILNPNTKVDNKVDGLDSLPRGTRWILENGMTKDDADEVVAIMDAAFERIHTHDDWTDRYEWDAGDGTGRKITLYARRVKYGKHNVVYYGGETIDYDLSKVDLDELVARVRDEEKTIFGDEEA
jgi:organic radical activating enzyme